MDWKPRSTTPTILLDKLFSPADGWQYSQLEVPVHRRVGGDGGTYFELTIDGVVLTVFEQFQWAANVKRTAPPHRLVMATKFTNLIINDYAAFLQDNFGMRSLPAFSIDQDGALNLTAAFPIGEGFPIDLARRQMMVCLGVITEQAIESLQHWNSSSQTTTSAWDTAGKVATVAGKFVGALLDL